MIKGIAKGHQPNSGNLGYHDKLVVPIIDNTPNERDLKDSMVCTQFEVATLMSWLLEKGYGTISKFTRSIGKETWSVCLGGRLGESKDNV